MKKNGFSHIRRWFLIHLILVVLVTLTTYIFIYKEIIVHYSSVALSTADQKTIEQPSQASHSVRGFKLRILLLFSAGMFFILFLSLIWMRISLRRINRPIRTIQRAVFRLAQGKLNETVDIESSDEFGKIGSNINELAANLQELLLYIWKQTGQCTHHLDAIKITQDSEISGQHVQELTEAIENLRQMAKSYVFYDVQLEGEKAIAINQPGRKSVDSIHQSAMSEHISK
jgi:methyl-accepting chemotaxis protein